MPTEKLAKMGLLISLGLIFSYVEALLPLFPGVPGIKLGLSNALVILLLYSYGWSYGVLFQFSRIVISSLLFGNLFSLVYSLAGAAVSLIMMLVFKRLGFFDIPGVSMWGGIFHNMGQLFIAFIFVQNGAVFYYSPILLISGALAGYGVGWIGELILKRRLL